MQRAFPSRWFVFFALFGSLVALALFGPRPPTKNQREAQKHLEQGLIAQRQGDNEAAIENFTEALRFDPDLAVAFLNRGIAFKNKADYERALQDLEKAIELLPNVPAVTPFLTHAYFQRGEAHRLKGDYEQSLADFAKAIELSPRNYDAYLQRSVVYEKMGDLDRAKEEKDKAIQLNPQLQGS
jgi:tetratricopeptide (TPR) repeat protein